MEKNKPEKRLISPNKLIFPITPNENGVLDEYIQTNDKICQENFTCSICTCLAWDPVCCPKCDKPFCRGCLTKYGKNKKCPFKCESTTFREITRNEKNYLNKIKIKCTNVGCSKYIPYSDYINHLEKCELRKYHCKNQPCKEEGYINEMINHSKICHYRLIECTKCKQLIKYCETKIHQQEVCPEITVKCKLCGSSMKRGIYLKNHKSDGNENINCLKLQVQKWSKLYNEEINNKNKEICELRKNIKELKRSKRVIEKENSKLIKNLGEIESFFKNGYNQFFHSEINDKTTTEETNNNNDSFRKKFMENLNKDYMSTQSSFFNQNTEENKIIYRNINSCEKEKKYKLPLTSKKKAKNEEEKENFFQMKKI
jgi:hypothetical protein